MVVLSEKYKMKRIGTKMIIRIDYNNLSCSFFQKLDFFEGNQ